MALKFKCTNCGEDIIVKYLKPGEIAQCRLCGDENEVPETAIPTGEEHVILKRSRDISKVYNEKQATSEDKTKKESIGYYISTVIFVILFPIVALWYGPKYLIMKEYVKGIVIILIAAVELIIAFRYL